MLALARTGSWSATMAMARGASRCWMMSPNNSGAGIEPRAEPAAQLAAFRVPPSCRPAACRRRRPACRAASTARAASTPSCTGARPCSSTGLPLPRATSSRTSSGFSELHAPLELRRREPRRMHDLDQHVGEAAVVVADHALARGVVPLGKRSLELPSTTWRRYGITRQARRRGTARRDTRATSGIRDSARTQRDDFAEELPTRASDGIRGCGSLSQRIDKRKAVVRTAFLAGSWCPLSDSNR